MEELSEARDDEQRVVDPHPEPDHRHEDLGDGVEVSQPRGEEQDEKCAEHRGDREEQRDHRRDERAEQHHQDHEGGDEPDDVAQTLGRRGALGLTRELDLHARSVRDRAQLIFHGDDARPGQLEPGLVVLHVEVGDLATVGQLLRPGAQRVRDRDDIGRVLGEGALRGSARDEHAVNRGGVRFAVERLPVLRRHHDPQRGTLLAAELGGDQVGRLLGVRARDLEVVDQLAVEGCVQPDQDDENRDPREDDAPRMPCAAARDGCERACVCDSLFFFDHDQSPCP